MRSTIEDVSNFVLSFIESSKNKKLKEEWTSSNTQDRLKKIFIKNDPKKPKKNKSAYLFFCEEMRPILKKKYPEFENKDILRNLGLEWEKIKNTKKFFKYQKFADNDKERYVKELQNYEKQNYEESDKEESDKEESDKEESDKEESDKEESDKEESDKEENDKEESDKKESDKEESDKEESDKEENKISNIPKNKDICIENNESDNESIGSDILNQIEIIIRENNKEKEKNNESSFDNFYSKKMKKMKKKYPDLSEDKIHKKIKKKWKKLSNEDKQKY